MAEHKCLSFVGRYSAFPREAPLSAKILPMPTSGRPGLPSEIEGMESEARLALAVSCCRPSL